MISLFFFLKNVFYQKKEDKKLKCGMEGKNVMANGRLPSPLHLLLYQIQPGT